MSYYMIIAMLNFNCYVYGIRPKIAHGIVFTESRYNPNAVGTVGELGLMQIRPYHLPGPISLLDPQVNMHRGLRKLRNLKRIEPKFGTKYFIAYNRGVTGLHQLNRNTLYRDTYYQSVITNVVRR